MATACTCQSCVREGPCPSRAAGVDPVHLPSGDGFRRNERHDVAGLDGVGAAQGSRSNASAHWGFLGLVAVSWLWAFLTCLPFWEKDPNYAYGWSVPPLMAFFLWRRLVDLPDAAWMGTQSHSIPTFLRNRWLLAVPALGVLPVEVYRNEFVQSGWVVWAINLWAVSLGLATAGWLGGRRIVLAVLFPILFHLSSVPWPSKIAHLLQQELMQTVAQTVAEILLWIGIPVTLNGAQLHMNNGVVGIVEACSGIRSLQTSIMVGLAIGELHMLTGPRRAGLLGLGLVLALVTNLARTFTLCWIMEHRGDHAMHEAHDLVGNVAMYSMLGLIYFGGRLLERPPEIVPTVGHSLTWADRWRCLDWGFLPDFRPLLAVGIAMVVLVHGWYFVLRVGTPPQVSGMFTSSTKGQPAVVDREFSESVWRTLGADTGEQFEVTVPDAPRGKMSFYHLFWKPGPNTMMALTHRPDTCMPGAGWAMRPDVGKARIEFNGVPMDFFVFIFDHPGTKVSAMQVWGVWRNGQPVDMDIGTTLSHNPEVLGILPSGRHLMGVELLSAFTTFEGEPPSLELFQRHVPRYFNLDRD